MRLFKRKNKTFYELEEDLNSSKTSKVYKMKLRDKIKLVEKKCKEAKVKKPDQN